MISAKIIADSLNQHGHRITTFVVVFPRIVLAEFNTHRMLSKNSASSRAIPFNKMLGMVQDNPFIPIRWMKEHKGMQGTDYFTDLEEIKQKNILWLEARNAAVEKAIALSEVGVTKQVCNRLLEPFMWHTVIVTGTDWDNFFALRAHPQAEIHIADLAHKMLDVYNASQPKLLRDGEWHIPFGDTFDADRILSTALKVAGVPPYSEICEDDWVKECEKVMVKIATARCARVSYLNFEGKDDYEADLKLHDMLSESGHWSPFEHCAVATPYTQYEGNFIGFKQYRKHFSQENKKDPRVEVKATSFSGHHFVD